MDFDVVSTESKIYFITHQRVVSRDSVALRNFAKSQRG